MRIIRFLDSLNQIHHGVEQADGTALRIEGDILANHVVTHQKIPVQKLLAPLQPAAILCIGLNYLAHMAELGSPRPQFPMLFMKNPASVQNPGDPILIPTHHKSAQVDWECELAIVIGKRVKNATRAGALEGVLGYTAACDVSHGTGRRTGRRAVLPGKSFDTFCPLGPALVTRDEIPHPNALRLRTLVNGEVRRIRTRRT